MRSLPKILSKSKLLRGYRCPKALYLTLHDPKKEAPVSQQLQALFDQGKEVGKEARKFLFPKGCLIDCKPWEFLQSVQKTEEEIQKGEKTIYEASFLYQGAYSRMDIIHYSKNSKKWSLYEVKSSTRVKDEHIDDITLQSWIISKSGLPIENIYLVHLNSACVFPDLKNLFEVRDVTQEVRDNYRSVPEKINHLTEVIKAEDPPSTPIGEYCLKPGECGFKNHCWKGVPSLSILNLPKFLKKWAWFEQGVVDFLDPRISGFNELQKRIVESHKTKKVFNNASSIRKILSSWSYPLTFLDFETLSYPIPKFNNTSPYEHIPFQFSIHILRKPDSPLEHYEFLHDQTSDPRPSLIKKLLKVCPSEGHLVAYYKDFEINVLKKLAESFSKDADSLMNLVERMKDPLPILRENYYDPKFQMSFSLKKVAPALLGADFSYTNIGIQDGLAAQVSYKKMLGSSQEKKEEIKKDLLEYCKKDTESLVEIFRFLSKQ
ncbi:MAG: DUF2779 domain-containing protein [Bdellovibrionales bacterium]